MKKALITGASQGIGNHIAKSLSSTHHLILPGRNIDKLKSDFQNQTILQMDLSREIPSLKLDPIHVYIHSAGMNVDSLLVKANPIHIQSMMNVNLISAMQLCQFILPGMIRNKSGCIILMSSVIALTGNSGQSVYGASKAALIGFVKSLAKEVGSRGIRVNCIAPGFINTEMTCNLPESIKTKHASMIPLQRFGDPKDIVSSVEYLLNASYVTGQTLIVDGGLS